MSNPLGVTTLLSRGIDGKTLNYRCEVATFALVDAELHRISRSIFTIRLLAEDAYLVFPQ